MTEALGWLSSCLLVLTIGKQVHKQWREGTGEGVSKWLFIGQAAASTGFTVYSWLVGNWVFVVTNALMLANAFVGLFLVLRHRRKGRTPARPGGGPGDAPSAGRETSSPSLRPPLEAGR